MVADVVLVLMKIICTMMKREIPLVVKHPCFKVVSVSKTAINNDFCLLLSGN